jgi:hypothetical protein
MTHEAAAKQSQNSCPSMSSKVIKIEYTTFEFLSAELWQIVNHSVP